MTKTVELEVAQNTLKDLIAGLGPDEEIVIVSQQRPIARLRASNVGTPRFGSCKELLTIVEEDNEHLQDFTDYMP